MAHLGMSVVSMLLSLLTAAAVDVESSFLQNRPELLLRHLSSRARLSLTLPEPVGFSDQLSAEQSYFFFGDILDRFPTQEFFPESGLPRELDRDRLILTARWAFRDKNTDDQYAFRLFFLFRLEKTPSPLPSAGGGGAGNNVNPWKITEIKAEKI